MASQYLIAAPLVKLFTDPKQFKSIFFGSIYIGNLDQDPLYPLHQQQVYVVDESNNKTPVTQPISIGPGGYAEYNGQPAKFVCDAPYSIVVLDKKLTEKWRQPNISTIDYSALDLNNLVRNFSGIKSLTEPAATIVNGQKVSVTGFYVGSADGGGQFVYDANRSTADHNGGTVIAASAITAWDGTQADIATLLNWSGTGAGCFVRIMESEFIDVSCFGAVYDSATDCSPQLQAANKANKHIIVSGKTMLRSTVTLTNDLSCVNDGEFVVTDQTTTLIKFTTKQTPRLINPVTVTGLTELSSSVGGFGDVESGGWAWIDSNEILINRSVVGGYYTKQEIITFNDDAGNLAVFVEENYNLGQIAKIEYYEPEKQLNVNVKARLYSGSQVDIDGLFLFEKRYVNAIVNADVNNIGSNIELSRVPNAVVNSPKIVGGSTGLGYGILGFIVGGILITNPSITGCRHGYSGRHDKNVTITGSGVISNDVDSHYGYNMNVTGGVTVVGNISFAGRDVRVKNIQHKSKDFGVQARVDTPEIKGVIEYSDNNVILNSTVDYSAVVIGIGNSVFFDFGRSLRSPSHIKVTNNTYHIESVGANFRYVWQRQPNNYLRDACKLIEIGSNTFTKVVPSYIQGLADLQKSDKISSTFDTQVNIYNELKITNNVEDKYAGTNFSYGFIFDISNVKVLANRIDSGALRDSKISSSYISLLSQRTVGTNSGANTMGNWYLSNCKFSNAAFDGSQNQLYICTGGIKITLMPDNSSLKWLFSSPANRTGTVTVVRASDGDRSGSFTYDAISPTVSKMAKIGGGTGIKTIDNVSLTGTSGVIGDLTLSCNANQLWLENRTGDVNLSINIQPF